MRRGVPTFILLLLIVGGMGLWAWSLGRGSGTPQPATAAVLPPPKGGALRVMTANIRLSEPADKENAWQNRRELCVKTFLKYQPDIIGCQEVTPAQGAYLSKELAAWYGYYPRAGIGTTQGTASTGRGGGRGVGGVGGALMEAIADTFVSLNTIYYRSDRFEAIDGQAGLVFPDQPQAAASENTFYTLVVLRERDAAAGRKVIVVDVHLRHDENFAARCGTRVREFIAAALKNYDGAEVILVGDMNHDRTSRPYAALVGPGAAGGVALTDSFDYGRKGAEERWGNWHEFTGNAAGQWPTDLIFFGAGLKAGAPGAMLIRDHDETGRYPSDHFFVMTELVGGK